MLVRGVGLLVAVPILWGQSYESFVPSAYTAERKWPVLYCLDPGARGKVPVERFAKAAEAEGVIVVGSNKSRNGPNAPVEEAIREMWLGTHSRFSVDDSRVYAAGFSGGARVALSWARTGMLKGVIACGAGFGDEAPEKLTFRFFASVGVDDFNYPELWHNSLALAKRGIEHRFVAFDGGHDWLPESLTREALQYMDGKIPGQAAVDSKEERRQDTRFRELVNEMAGGENAGLIRSLQRQAKQERESGDRRVARRVLNGTFVGSMEEARNAMYSKDYAAATRAWELATRVRPEAANAWYGLAIAQAGTGQEKRAADSLQKAEKAGFQDWDRARKEPLLKGALERLGRP